MRPFRKSASIAVTGALAALTLLVTTVPASAATLKGDWAPFTRCPVDDPAMLAADGVSTVDLCIASHSPSGTIKLGSITATTGASDLQLGLLSSASGFRLVSPSGGGIVSDPVKVPGGLLGLMCPSKLLLVAQLCQQATDNSLNNVFATVEPAGAPSDFNLAAGLGTGQPILTLPVKIHLQNPLLAATCTIGSDSNPILLKPANLTSPTAGFTRFDGDGTDDPANGALLRIGLTGAAQGDNSFAVPGATGCGLLGLANTAINLKSGLPSPAGKNSLVLNDASTFLAGFNIPSDFAPNSGQQLSSLWHSAQQS
jgi:hypothetical protein